MTDHKPVISEFAFIQTTTEKRNTSTPRKSEKFQTEPKYQFNDKFDLNEMSNQIFRPSKIAGKTRSTTQIPDLSKINLKRNSEFSQIPAGNAGNINVICRFRPLNAREIEQSQELCVEFLDKQNISIKLPTEKNPVKFSFDHIFDMSATQQDVFECAAKPIIESVMEGFNGTIFAYGQTSSGKTHTMQGVLDDPELAGITPRIIEYVFNHISSINNTDIEFKVKVSMIEVYMEKINDLLDTNNSDLKIREDKVKGIYVDKLSENYVSSMEEVFELIRIGTTNRAIACTNMNQQSSRSHLIFLMTINQFNTQTFISKTGKLYLVDLAGSEKISKTGATGHVLDEAKLINKSLTTLGMVINNLSEGKGSHVPYRDSKLTRILQESIGGNSKTRLIIACSPSSFNDSETLSTCRFGSRAKNIKNKPKINKEITVAELKIEIEKMEKIIYSTNIRLEQLESFIKIKNLEIPVEGDFSFLKPERSISKNSIDKEADSKISLEALGIENKNSRRNSFCDKLSYKYHEKDGDYMKTFCEEGIIKIAEEKELLNKKYEELLNKIIEFSFNTLNEDKQKFTDDLEDFRNKHLNLLDEFSKLQENSEMEISKTKKLNSQKMETLRKYSEGKKLINEKDRLIKVSKFYIEECGIPFDVYLNVKSLFENPVEDPRLRMIEFVNCMYSIEKSLDISYLDDERTLTSFNFLESQRNDQFTILSKIKRGTTHDHEFNEKNHKSKNYLEEKYLELISKIMQLEYENKELRQKILPWLEKLQPGEKDYMEKTMELHNKILGLNTIYHQLISQKSVMMIEIEIMQKKISKRDERIKLLTEENIELRELNKMKDEKLTLIQKTLIKNSDPPNVVKIIRGGRVKSLHSNFLNEINQSFLSPSKSQRNINMLYLNSKSII